MPKTKAGEPRVDIVDITPEMAADWLNANTHNRTLRNRKVNELQEAIERGEWRFNADAIRFDTNGVLIDGQHRLWAIHLSGQTVRNLVVWDLEPEAQLTIDVGEKRRLSDHLKLQGYPSSVALSAIINFKWKLDNGLVRTGRIPTIAQALDVLRKHPDLTEGIRMAGRFHTRFAGSTAAIGALYHEFAQIDPDAAEEFFERLIEGTDLSATNPIYALRRQLESHRLSTVQLAALTIKAWNAWWEGREVSQLSWRPVGKAPEPFPAIEGGL